MERERREAVADIQAKKGGLVHNRGSSWSSSSANLALVRLAEVFISVTRVFCNRFSMDVV